jgi:multicomponent Na+:H+ antiporter subunit C
METLLCWLVGILFGMSIFLILNRSMIQMLFGLMLVGTSINLFIFIAGRLTLFVPAFVSSQKPDAAFANSLPQSLILTSIVIGFGVVTYALVLIVKTWQEVGTMNIDEMHLAEDCQQGELE